MRSKKHTKSEHSSTIPIDTRTLRIPNEKTKKRNSKKLAKPTACYQIPKRKVGTIADRIWTILTAACQVYNKSYYNLTNMIRLCFNFSSRYRPDSSIPIVLQRRAQSAIRLREFPGRIYVPVRLKRSQFFNRQDSYVHSRFIQTPNSLMFYKKKELYIFPIPPSTFFLVFIVKLRYHFLLTSRTIFSFCFLAHPSFIYGFWSHRLRQFMFSFCLFVYISKVSFIKEFNESTEREFYRSFYTVLFFLSRIFVR